MTNGKDVKPSSITKKMIKYLIACIAMLIWLGLLAEFLAHCSCDCSYRWHYLEIEKIIT